MPQTAREADRVTGLNDLAAAARVPVPLNAAQLDALNEVTPFLRPLPERMRGGLIRYLLVGVMPGDFLQAVLANDLLDTLGRADDANMTALRAWGHLLYGGLPATAHGSRERLLAWVARGGLARPAAAGDPAAPAAAGRAPELAS